MMLPAPYSTAYARDMRNALAEVERCSTDLVNAVSFCRRLEQQRTPLGGPAYRDARFAVHRAAGLLMQARVDLYITTLALDAERRAPAFSPRAGT